MQRHIPPLSEPAFPQTRRLGWRERCPLLGNSMENVAVEQLLATTHLTSQVDIKQLLSSEYDSSVEDGAPSSMEESSSPWGKAAAMLESPSDEYEPSSVRTLGGKLQGALAARNAELSELEKLYRKERRRDREAIRQLRGDNEALQRTTAAAQTRATGELRAYRLSVEAVHARSRAELDELRSQLQALQQEVPTLRAALAASKSDFAQLSVDAPTYEVLRKRPSDELSVVEHVQMRVFDLVAAAERRGAVSAAAAPALSTSAHAVASASSSSAAAAAGAPPEASGGSWALRQVEAAAQDALTARLNEANARAEQRHAEAEEARAECRRLRQEAMIAAATPEGQARSEMNAARKQVAELQAVVADAKERAASASAERDRGVRRATEAEATCAFLTQDKEYLKTQVASLEERASAAEQRVAKKDAALAELKAELSMAKQELLANARGAAEEFAVRLESERQRWERHAEASQHAHGEAHQMSLSTHKDARELALAEADKWQTRYVQLQREHDSTVREAAEASGRAHAQSAELRAECKLRAFEAERLRMQAEGAVVSARQSQVDFEAASQKLEVLRAEYYRLQSASAAKVATLEASHAALSERVGTYERLEEQLDQAVLQLGAAAYETGSGAPVPSTAVQPFLRVPSSSQRRMEQCLGLARDLVSAQRRAAEAEAQRATATAEQTRLQGVVAELQRRVHATAGSTQGYLADQLEQAEKARMELEARTASLQQQLVEHADALAGARQQNELLLRDLESLLSQRGSLDALRTTLSRLLPAELAPAIAS